MKYAIFAGIAAWLAAGPAVAQPASLAEWRVEPDCSATGPSGLQEMAVRYSTLARQGTVAVVEFGSTITIERYAVSPGDARVVGRELGEIAGLAAAAFEAQGCAEAVRDVLRVVPMFAVDPSRTTPGTLALLRLRREQMARIYAGHR